jgi:hypothetical protein
MRSLLQSIRNIWCLVTGRCEPHMVVDEEDPVLTELRRHEEDAYREAAKSRERTQVRARRGIEEGWRRSDYHAN